MHLDSILVGRASSGGPYQKVQAGEEIGIIGQSGTTGFNHLHFEIRVGTTCSYEGNCSKGYDPHVNPLMFLDYRNTNNIKVEVLRENPLRVKVLSDRDELDFNSIKVVYNGETRQFSFNERIGLDLNNLDNNYFKGIKILPAQFNTEARNYEIVFEFDLSGYDSIEALDVWGGGVKITK